MQHSRQVSLIKRIFAHIDAGTTDLSTSIGLNAVENYFCTTHQALEKEKLGVFDAFGEHSRVVYPRKTIHTLRDQPEDTWDLLKHSIIVYVLFPNSLVIWQRDHVEIWRVFPDPGADPGMCRAEVSLYSPVPAINPKMRSYWDRNMALLMRTVEEEDFPLAEGVQQGLSSGAQSHLTFGRHEPALSYFHDQLKRALAPTPV